MCRLPLYEVKEEAYLFPNKVRTDDERKKREEPVRQWCAYEMMRAYGYAISDLEFEHPVRVGSKRYKLDILISLRGTPHIVLECKHPKDSKVTDAMEQAVSYAKAEGINAEFVVCTNGNAWHVKRRIGKEWAPVPDIPHRLAVEGTLPLTALLLVIRDLAPILYNLDQHLEGDDAGHFLDALQRFFCGPNLLTLSVNEKLLVATDNLLRVLSSVGHYSHYRFGKLAHSFKAFTSYWKEAGFDYEISLGDRGEPIKRQMRRLHALLSSTISNAQGLTGWDLLVLKLDLVLAEYGERQSDSEYPPIGSNVHHALRGFLDYGLAIWFNTRLPDSSDTIDVGEMRTYCSLAWEEIKASDKSSLQELCMSWMQFMLSRLFFWRDRS